MIEALLLKLEPEIQLLVPRTDGSELLSIKGGKGNAIYGIHWWDRDISSPYKKIPKVTEQTIAQIFLCSTTERSAYHFMEEFLPSEHSAILQSLHQMISFINFNQFELNKLMWGFNIVPIFPYIDHDDEYYVACPEMYHGRNLLRFYKYSEFKKREYKIYSKSNYILPIPDAYGIVVPVNTS